MDEPEHLDSWLYTSCSLLKDTSRPAIDHIVAIARRRNAELAVTGALICTGSYFAQFVEGPPASIAALRASILRDDRHEDVRTHSAGPQERRQFADWSLAYASNAPEFDRLVGVARSMRGPAGQALLFEMIRRFADEPDD